MIIMLMLIQLKAARIQALQFNKQNTNILYTQHPLIKYDF